MTVRLINCTASGNRVGLKVTGAADVDVLNSDFSHNIEAGIQVCDNPESLLARLGLPANTPVRDLRELLGQLAHMHSEPDRKRIAVVRTSKLMRWLKQGGGVGLNLTTLAATLATWASSPQGQSLLSKLGG
jgi:hypothetical protein